MHVQELLFEMPKSINAISIDLDMLKLNRKHALSFLSAPSRELVKAFPDDVNLYEIGRKLVLIDQANTAVVYFMEWTEIFHKFVNHAAASQVLVWRDKSAGFNDFAQYVFFEVLLEKYGVVITDALQTPDGERFWLRRVQDAFALNHKVFYLNLMPSAAGVNRELTEIKSTKEFNVLNREKNFWGDAEKFRARKIIISKNVL